ncbi:MAG: hypothetical protein ACR2G4_07425 [Pyrinomonadaceae bacterium]
MRLLLLLTLLTQVACTASTAVPQPEQVRRLPLEKSGIKLKAPTHYEPRVASVDPKTNEPVYYDPKPQIVPVDEKAGKYAFKWIGYDGKEKTIIYQRADAIDAVVSALVERNSSEQYLYTYKIENLPSGGSQLSGFIVQNFAAEVQPIKTRDGRVGRMSNDIQQFRDGNWIHFGPSYLKDEVTPGRSVELQLQSSVPPGLVGCRIYGGERTIKGVGEHMPTELENALSGYEGLPRGYTIGPIDKIKGFSQQEHIQYILSILPQAHKLGWITESARRWYEDKLKSDDLEAVHERLEHDLKTEQITTEVFAMMRAMK